MFDNDFDKKFDERMRSVRRLAIAHMIFNAALKIGTLGFLGWVIVMVLRHCGVI